MFRTSTHMNSIHSGLIFALLLATASAHSLMAYPQPTAAKSCRLGGVPVRGGILLCPGPCDVRPLQPGFPPLTSPNKPAATFSRGQTVTIKYQRNNHGPGGFVRHTLVPVSQMMNKQAHARNAFHYACWGANPVAAKPSELGTDKFGFSLVGGDGKLHNLPKSYYITKVTIPPVVPDGVYVLGWVWYGGMGGTIEQNLPQSPHTTGLFADYWSCSFVRIEGGSALQASYKPVFVNDMERYWKDGCMAANDRPGVCVYEPCRVPGKIQKPAEFKDGKGPSLLTIANFGNLVKNRASGEDEEVVPTSVPDSEVLKKTLAELQECEKRTKAKNLGATLGGSLTTSLPAKEVLKQTLAELYQCKEGSMKAKSMEEMVRDSVTS